MTDTKELIERLWHAVTDWDGSQEVDGAELARPLACGEARAIIATIERLSAERDEARKEFRQAIGVLERKMDVIAAERERREKAERLLDEARRVVEPFAKEGEMHIGHLRAARAFLDKTPEDRPTFRLPAHVVEEWDNALTTALARADRPAVFEFDRYINGTLMAEGVTIERQPTLEGAMRKAASIASRGPNREVPVLVVRSVALATPAVTDAMVEAALFAFSRTGGTARNGMREALFAALARKEA